MKINLRSEIAAQLEEQEVIELVPNIILNPGFFDERTEHVPQDENFNNQTTTRLNNNSVVFLFNLDLLCFEVSKLDAVFHVISNVSNRI